MPKTDKGPTKDRTSGQSARAESDVSGHYPSDDEWADSLERAEDVKEQHDSLFRRLAGKDA